MSQLAETAQSLFAPSKGILASDERAETLNKKFQALNIPQTLENRTTYRELILTTPGIENYLSGVILNEETLQTISSHKLHFAEILTMKGIMPGVKLDGGTVPFAGLETSLFTEGLDGLSDRLKLSKSLGATFTKWRSVFHATDTDEVILVNSLNMAYFGLSSQKEELVCILEPELIRDESYSIEQNVQITERLLITMIKNLRLLKVDLSAVILKSHFILDSEATVDSNNSARQTVQLFNKILPHELAGVVFLSGGLSGEKAREILSNLYELHPTFKYTFSFLRAIEQDVLEAWHGDMSNKDMAQKVLIERLRETTDALG